MSLLAGGHALLVGVPGLGKTKLVETLGTVLGLDSPAGAVHARPDAGRHPGLRGAGGVARGRDPGPPGLPLHPRPGLLPAADGRRDQPRLAAHPVGPAAGHAGAAAWRWLARSWTCPPPSTCWPPRTRSSRRAPTRCPRPSSTASCCEIEIGYPDEAAERAMLLATTGASEARPEQRAAGGGADRRPGPDPPHAGGRGGAGRHPAPGPRRAAGNRDAAAVKQHLAWGPGPRAAQALMLATRARAVLDGRLAPERGGRAGAGRAGAPPPHGAGLRGAGGRRPALRGDRCAEGRSWLAQSWPAASGAEAPLAASRARPPPRGCRPWWWPRSGSRPR